MGIKNEDIVMEKMANHYRKILAIGGNLILTKTSLIFKPHPFNIGGKEVVINLKDIDDIGKTLIVGPHANQIWVKSKGQRFRFSVWDRDKFLDAIDRARSQTNAKQSFCCKVCGAQIGRNQKHCGNCGRALEWGTQP